MIAYSFDARFTEMDNMSLGISIDDFDLEIDMGLGFHDFDNVGFAVDDALKNCDNNFFDDSFSFKRSSLLGVIAACLG